MRIALMFLLASCGGGTKPTPTTGSDCEPGRCLPDISKVVSEKRPAAKACYEAGLKRDPAIKGGRIIVNFDIEADGTPTNVTPSMKSDQIEEAETVACVVEVVKQLKFTASAKGKTTHAYHAFEFGKLSKQ